VSASCSANGEEVTAIFNEAVTTLGSTGFSVGFGGETRGFEPSVAGSGTTTLTFTVGAGDPIYQTDTVILHYDTGPGGCRNASGIELEDVADFPVTNNSTEEDPAAATDGRVAIRFERYLPAVTTSKGQFAGI
jgi:hypothetical protein